MRGLVTTPFRLLRRAPAGAGEGEEQHGGHVVQRHRADDDQGDGARVAVDILQKGHAQQGDAAAVAALDELAPKGLVLHPQAGQGHDQDGGQAGQEAEEDEAPVPHREEVGADQILEEHDGQADFKDEAVEFAGKGVVYEAPSAEGHPQQHQQKDGDGGVQAVD